MIVALSSLGLPLLNGFVGEFLIILGAFHARPLFGALAALGVVLAAVYLLWMYQRVFFGTVTNEKNRHLPDCTGREKIILVAVVLVILWMGIYPQPFLRRLDLCVAQVIQRVQPGPTSLARPQPIQLAERSR
jgi:NADH-quinone oxidoreductase subunit M